MTPTQRAMYREVAAMMCEFYGDPENERRYQEWKRERGRAPSASCVGPAPGSPATPGRQPVRHAPGVTTTTEGLPLEREDPLLIRRARRTPAGQRTPRGVRLILAWWSIRPSNTLSLATQRGEKALGPDQLEGALDVLLG